MKIQFDTKLQKRLLNGDKSAFTETIEVCKGLVYASALGIVKNKHDAEDVTQDVFTLLYKKRESIKEDTNIPVWLYTATVFISKRLLRHQKVKSAYKKEEVNAMNEEISSSNELKDVVLEELSNLSLKYRDVLIRHYVLDEKYKDIAEHLGVNLSTVAMQIKRGLEKLKKNLSRKGYAISTAMLLSIFVKPENAFAASSLDASHISSQVFKNTDAFRVYRSGNDSQAFKYFSQSSKVAFSLKPYLFVLLLISSGAYVINWLNRAEKSETRSPMPVIADNTNIVQILEKPLIWNHENGNLTELNPLEPYSIHKIQAKTNIQYLSNIEKDSVNVFLPFDFPKTPIKVTFKVRHISNSKGKIGLVLVKNGSVMPHTQFQAPDQTLGSYKIFNLEYYFYKKASTFVAENKMIHKDFYTEDIERARILFNMQYIDLFEVKVEKMSDDELKRFEEEVATKDEEGGTFYARQEIPKYDRIR